MSAFKLLLASHIITFCIAWFGYQELEALKLKLTRMKFNSANELSKKASMSHFHRELHTHNRNADLDHAHSSHDHDYKYADTTHIHPSHSHYYAETDHEHELIESKVRGLDGSILNLKAHINNHTDFDPFTSGRHHRH